MGKHDGRDGDGSGSEIRNLSVLTVGSGLV
jgi:hypothetical protein